MVALVKNNASPNIGRGDLFSELRSICSGKPGRSWLHVLQIISQGDQKNIFQSVQKHC